MSLMRMKVYLPTNPETVISLYNTGRLPDRLPRYCQQSEIFFYADLASAFKAGLCVRNTFVLKIALPDNFTDYGLHSYLDREASRAVAYGSSFNTDWIESIHIAGSPSKKLFHNRLNGEYHHPLIIENTIATKRPRSSITVDDKPASLPAIYGQVSRKGDLLGSKCHALVNPVNCVGVMGKGIALCFKKQYPEMFADYKRRCDLGEVKPGVPYLYVVNQNRVIINFPTKNHWRNKTRLSWVISGIDYIVRNIDMWGVRSIAMPPLGCGNGGLNWDEVKPHLKTFALTIGKPVELYEPFQASRHGCAKAKSAALVTASSGDSAKSSSPIYDHLKAPTQPQAKRPRLG